MLKPKQHNFQSQTIQYMASNECGWGDLFIKFKLVFAAWINVFFCLTGESQLEDLVCLLQQETKHHLQNPQYLQENCKN